MPPVVAALGGFDGLVTPVSLARDALMTRSVEQQVVSFAAVHEHVKRQYLADQWGDFVQRTKKLPSNQGKLTSFLGDLQRAEVTKIFVPKRSFRGLSPGNPYLKKEPEGTYEEIRPMDLCLRLMSCREQMAEFWVELMPSLSLINQPSENTTATATASAANYTGVMVEPTIGTVSRDRQILLGMATKIATHQMLRELSTRPSCRHMHEWLSSYLLVQHAIDLSERGSVQRLHADLVAQPICFRGGALVDPLDLSVELFQRSVEILEQIEEDLRLAPEHVVPYTSKFFEDCLLL